MHVVPLTAVQRPGLLSSVPCCGSTTHGPAAVLWRASYLLCDPCSAGALPHAGPDATMQVYKHGEWVQGAGHVASIAVGSALRQGHGGGGPGDGGAGGRPDPGGRRHGGRGLPGRRGPLRARAPALLGAEDRPPQPIKVALGLSRCALAWCIPVGAVPAKPQVATHAHADC